MTRDHRRYPCKNVISNSEEATIVILKEKGNKSFRATIDEGQGHLLVMKFLRCD